MRCGSPRDEHWRQCPVDQLTVARGDGEASAGGLGNDHAVKGSLRSQSSWLAIVASAESITGSVAFMPANGFSLRAEQLRMAHRQVGRMHGDVGEVAKRPPAGGLEIPSRSAHVALS